MKCEACGRECPLHDSRMCEYCFEEHFGPPPEDPRDYAPPPPDDLPLHDRGPF